MKFVVAVTAAAAAVMVVTTGTPAPTTLTIAAKLAKQAKGVATVQARCEALAFDTHAQLGYEEWYIEEAMIYQAAECLATTIVEWFDVCENYCTSCGIARKCQAEGNAECAWWNGACHFGDRVTVEPVRFTLQLTGAKYTEFGIEAENDYEKAAQQILDWIFEDFSDIWAELEVNGVAPLESNGQGVKITANFYHTDAVMTRAFIESQQDFVNIATGKWNNWQGSITVLRRRLKTVWDIKFEPPLKAGCGNAGCTECLDSPSCNAHSDCIVDHGCQFKNCTAATCDGCASKAHCLSAKPCFWDVDDVCKGCNSLDCVDCPNQNKCETAQCLFNPSEGGNGTCLRKACGSSPPASSCKACFKQQLCDSASGCSWEQENNNCSASQQVAAT